MKTLKIISAIVISLVMIATYTVSASGGIKILKNSFENQNKMSSSFVTASESANHIQVQSGMLTVNTSLSISDKDMSYLKFRVGDYSNDGVTVVNTKSSTMAKEERFDYLKFEVAAYMEVDANMNEVMELPRLDAGYLKFDVNTYIDANEINLIDGSDLPADEYSYLKFDVNNFSGCTPYTENSDDLPISE